MVKKTSIQLKGINKLNVNNVKKSKKLKQESKQVYIHTVVKIK